ncbi:MAG: hypothetical protein Q8K83_00115 [Methylotenera sp.]|nr:hypothetical protein [Methylotenera sp.]
MKNLIAKIFNKEPKLNYIIAEYQPMEINSLSTVMNTTEYDVEEPAEIDEMQIDKIYQSL